MGRTFVAQRGQKKSNEVRQIRHDRHTPDVRYTLNDAVGIFIKAKEAEGLRNSTIKGYFDTVRYFRDWLNPDIENIDEITSSILRDNITYLKNDRLPYQGDEHNCSLYSLAESSITENNVTIDVLYLFFNVL